MIPKTPLYKGIVIFLVTIALSEGVLINFAHFQVIIACTKGFPDNNVIDNMATSLTAWRKLPLFGDGLVQLPSKLDIMIPKTPLCEGMVV